MDKAFLEDCLARGMSLKSIAREVGQTHMSVSYWLKKHGLEASGRARFSQKGPLEREQLEKLVEENLTLQEIALELGVKVTRVAYWVRCYGLGPTAGGRRVAAVRAAREAGIKEIELDCPRHGLTVFSVGKTHARCRKCNSEGVSRRRRRVKQILVQEAGGRCVGCGYDRSLAALGFHHLDPAAKTFAVSGAGITRSLDSSRREAAKCVLLCANCHAEVEVGARRVPLD